MPWKESSLMSCRFEFVQLARQPGSNIRELCRRFDISAKTAYKWLGRYEQNGPPGLQDMSRRPTCSPCRTSTQVELAVLALHKRFPYWGPRKLRALLEQTTAPAPSTIAAILRRHGCQVSGEDSGAATATQRFEHEAPNELWQMDFKGHFPLTDARHGRCHPLTLLDDHSRYALCIQACGDERSSTVQQHLKAVFRRYGLPERITADNGPSWASVRGTGLTGLEVWLMRLGVRISHSRPHHPQTQGKLERLHRTLKRELLQARGFSNLLACQQAMDRWREQYNHIRPHQALGQMPPLSRYRPSPRPYPAKLPAIEYAPGERVLKVRAKGQIIVDGRVVFVSEGMAGLPVAVRPSSCDGVLDVVFLYKIVQKIDLREPR